MFCGLVTDLSCVKSCVIFLWFLFSILLQFCIVYIFKEIHELTSESVEEFLSKNSAVNEDNCLSLLFTTIYDVFDKINFRVLHTTEVKLLDVVKLQLLLL